MKEMQFANDITTFQKSSYAELRECARQMEKNTTASPHEKASARAEAKARIGGDGRFSFVE